MKLDYDTTHLRSTYESLTIEYLYLQGEGGVYKYFISNKNLFFAPEHLRQTLLFTFWANNSFLSESVKIFGRDCT